LNRVENSRIAFKNEIVETPDDIGTFAELEPFPARLGFPGTSDSAGNAGRRGNFYMPNNFTGGRISDFDNLSPYPRNYDTGVVLL
jgi:hypothetical protein